jgi:ribosomal protein S1
MDFPEDHPQESATPQGPAEAPATEAAAPALEAPVAEVPAPEMPAPEMPAPEAPAPEAPAPEEPEPITEGSAPGAQAPAPAAEASAPITEGTAPAPKEPPAPDPRKEAARAAWQRICEVKEAGETLQGKVLRAVKGGLMLDVDGYRAFLPATQSRPEKGQPIESLVGTTVPIKILDLDEKQKRLVVSHRRAVGDDRRAARTALLESLTVGADREATVVRLADFGAFVDLGGGVDALIPLSELAFENVKAASDVVAVGDKLKVRIIRVDASGKRIAASRKAALHDPWREHAALLKPGTVVTGKVVGKDGRLDVEIAPDVIGSVSDRDADPEEYAIGESIEVTVRFADQRNRRLRLTTMHAAAVHNTPVSGFAPLGIELKKNS